ncbi:hypothetical protein [Paenibacillus silvae]|uniref:Uncharacterized protein n=1 Tax=Paenibacillus silvae TaxID=1325358 RepID=A0A2W6NNU3_9BACL|nr:hypothetical protein [Paenibacillus silvae]PZT57501.1 hypothetical protein DN757_02275 [Paenibacillus silvae]
MKAKINGIEVEGTPEEILEFNLKMEKHINQLVIDMKKYTPFPSPSIAPSPHLLPMITSNNFDSYANTGVNNMCPARIMEVDYGKDKSYVTFKDLKNNSIQTLSFSKPNNFTCKEMSDFIIQNSFHKNIDQIHIHTNGFGIGVYDFLYQSHLKDKIVPLKQVKSL